jgi:hypothetical protein
MIEKYIPTDYNLSKYKTGLNFKLNRPGNNKIIMRNK